MDLYGYNQKSGKIASEKWRFGNLFLNASIFGQKTLIIGGFQKAFGDAKSLDDSRISEV